MEVSVAFLNNSTPTENLKIIVKQINQHDQVQNTLLSNLVLSILIIASRASVNLKVLNH